jgi:hypothetical protein
MAGWHAAGVYGEVSPVTCVWGARGGAGSLVAPSGRLHLVDHETDANEASHVKEKDSQR